jgi:hypothetical protein
MAAAETQDRTELDQVESWRRQELERAGYGVAAARELALRHDVDLHAAIALLENGCPAEVAVQILL